MKETIQYVSDVNTAKLNYELERHLIETSIHGSTRGQGVASGRSPPDHFLLFIQTVIVLRYILSL
ncbi:hypothetical protein [Sphingobacterium gobiense]|uniref:hypothetical protein n=1 Tax=Sphingobacterium gobiense TaxID=1382456 RepID=UPI0011AFE24B|nr:hypothetical protein [Sphingobacterium gobiense]